MVTTRSGKTYVTKTRYVKRKSRGRRDTAAKALKMVRSLKRIVAPEVKYKLYTTSFSPSSTPAVAVLNSIAQGDGFNQREGDKIKVLSISGAFEITNNTAAAIDTSYRIALIYNNDAGTFTYSNVYDPTAGVSQWIVPKNPNTPTYTILKEWNGVCQDFGSAGVKRWKFFVKVNKDVWFDPGVTTFKKGCIQLALICNQGVNTPTVQNYIKVNFSG